MIATWVAVAGLLAAERAGWRAGVLAAKPLASTGFLAVAWSAGALESLYGRVLLLALILCWLGDVLLLGRGRGTGLRLGLVSFLLGHIAYAVAFALRGLDPLACLAAAAGLLVPGFLVLRWLLPQAPSNWRIPVLAYAGVISVMAVSALGSLSGPGGAVIALGALAFYASDLAVARERFVQSSFANKAWGLPLYYGAQLLLASTARSV